MDSESRVPYLTASPEVMLGLPGPGIKKLKVSLQILISGFGGFPTLQSLQIVNKTFCDFKRHSASVEKIPEMWYLKKSLMQVFLEINDKLP